jgi:hypothetical protein
VALPALFRLRFKVQGSGFDVGCWMLDVDPVWLLAHRHLPCPFLLTGRQSRRCLPGEARARSGGGERAYRGRPDYGYLAAASPRFQRIPLAARHLRSRRFSAPPWRQFVAGGQVSVSGSDRVRPPWCMGVLRQFLQTIQRALGARKGVHQTVDCSQPVRLSEADWGCFSMVFFA